MIYRNKNIFSVITRFGLIYFNFNLYQLNSQKFSDKPIRKGSVVTLCDMSGSVWATGRFMLNVLYSLQECFTKVKSYIFVNNVQEVSEFFNNYDINQAIDKVLSESGLNLSAYTDYGTSFLRFYQNHLNALSSKTTLLIIGDARSNYMNPREDILQELRSRCRRVIWLNPETPNTWNTGDSEMSTLAELAAALQSARLMAYEAAWALDQGVSLSENLAVLIYFRRTCKWFLTEYDQLCADLEASPGDRLASLRQDLELALKLAGNVLNRKKQQMARSILDATAKIGL